MPHSPQSAAFDGSDTASRPDHGINRRNFLRRAVAAGAMATTGTALAAAPARAASPQASADTVRLSDYGAAGDGTTDDTAAIQSALNAAQTGTTVVGDASATYLVSSTLTFPTDGVTLNLDGASVQVGAQRSSGSPLDTNDTLFSCSDRSGVRITGGSLLSSASAFTGSGMPYRIQVCGGNGCRVDTMSAQCDGSAFILVTGSAQEVDHNTIEAGSIVGWDTTDLVIESNTLSNSPSDAITVNGFTGGGCSGTQYLNNVITGYGRIGIEDYCPDGPQLSQAPVFRGNQISAPASGGATGISAMATGATISDNTITDALGWAIEANGLGTTITNNTLAWSSPSTAAFNTTAIVVNTSNPADLSPVLVHGNTITGPGDGIVMFGDLFYCPVTITANTVTNPLSTGIVLAAAQNPGGVALVNNTVAFTDPPFQNTNRIGIKSAENALMQGNRVTFTPETYAAGVQDTPFFLVGDGVTMIANVGDGGGRSDGQLVSSSVGGNYGAWTLSANQFINGATVDLGGLTLTNAATPSTSTSSSTWLPEEPLTHASAATTSLTSADPQAATALRQAAHTPAHAGASVRPQANRHRPRHTHHHPRVKDRRPHRRPRKP